MSQFDKKRVKRWRRDTWRLFAKQGFNPADITAALVLAALAGFGTDVSVLSELTGTSSDYVKKILRRLRQQKMLRGQTLRVQWEDDKSGSLAVILDAGVAANLWSRFVDPKRSAAQKARASETRHRGPKRPRVVIPEGAVFSPQIRKSNPLYGHCLSSTECDRETD